MSDALSVQEAENHFSDARRRSFLNDLAAHFHHHTNDLLPYHEISLRTAPESEHHEGVRTIRLDQIVGSVGRFQDFDRRFLPRNRRTARRWKWIDQAWHRGTPLPAIEVIRVGDVYFVKDGNHRVSVARQHGQEFIEADVVEEHLRVPLSPDMSSAQLLLQAEYSEFLRRTNLDQLRPDHDIRPTQLGDYGVLWDHIEAHRDWLETEFERRPVGLEEAVTRWYDRVYLPIVRLVREHGVDRQCPGRTEADLYLWAMSRREELYEEYTRTREPYESARTYVDAMTAGLDAGPRWFSGLRKAVRRSAGRDQRRSRQRREGIDTQAGG